MKEVEEAGGGEPGLVWGEVAMACPETLIPGLVGTFPANSNSSEQSPYLWPQDLTPGSEFTFSSMTSIDCVTLGRSLSLSEPSAPLLHNRTKLPPQRKAVKMEWAGGCGGLVLVPRRE